MFEITSFLLKHLYEMMADNYIYHHHQEGDPAGGGPMGGPADLAAAARSAACGRSSRAAANQLKQRQPSPSSKRKQQQQQQHHHHNHQQQRAKKRSKRMVRQACGDNEDTLALEEGESAIATDGANAVALINDESHDSDDAQSSSSAQMSGQSFEMILRLSREQETNQQIISFLTNNQLPDLACDTFIELLFICVFLAFSWIFVMIIQLHFNQFGADPLANQQPAKNFYCNTQLLASLMYCYNKGSNQLAY